MHQLCYLALHTYGSYSKTGRSRGWCTKFRKNRLICQPTMRRPFCFEDKNNLSVIMCAKMCFVFNVYNLSEDWLWVVSNYGHATRYLLC